MEVLAEGEAEADVGVATIGAGALASKGTAEAASSDKGEMARVDAAELGSEAVSSCSRGDVLPLTSSLTRMSLSGDGERECERVSPLLDEWRDNVLALLFDVDRVAFGEVVPVPPKRAAPCFSLGW